ncbi:hypothetical protein NEF87_004004 [Candidatus Lokiarchaeum ossiferum]|uniref:Zinc ribbon domain-containing protein n=1 Tax=Candidatus Lokiarchaeum ossiferum TaxID=2951803 RepID=A0ABY6HYT4_9ARCH|nr:hypothetical protein NEF87_004004 [Candidatus Lokiarchaeum sp. B-35]
MSYHTWNSFMGLFQANDIVSMIVGITIAVLVSILALWLTFQILKLTFWSLAVFFRALFLGLAILLYTLILVFITAPIGMIFQGKNLLDIMNDYAENLKDIVYIFYPELEKWINKKIVKSAPVATVPIRQSLPVRIHPKRTIRPVKVVKPIVQSPPKSRMNEMDAKTIIVKNPSELQTSAAKFFCTDCGSEFTPIMSGLLQTKNTAFCQKCGKRFNYEHGLPVPASKI